MLGFTMGAPRMLNVLCRNCLIGFALFIVIMGLDSRRCTAALDLNAPLPVDPDLHRGILDNGVVYWIRSHATPPGKISFWLHVDTGSINELEGQEGISHYLEHLAFNGTQHFPPGELIKFFESMGLRFGQHQNAFTSFNQTTYTLTLPNTDADTIDKGLLYLSDVAFGMLLTPEEIDQERNVILEESRARKGANQRLFEQLLPILFPGSRVAKRLPIGLETTINRLQRDDFLAYYKKWYQPSKITILAVGDLPVEKIRAAIAKHFAAWQSDVPTTPNLNYGITTYTHPRAIVLTDPELSTASVETMTVGPKHAVTTLGDFRQRLIEHLGTWMVNRRLDQLIQEGKASFQSADVSTGELFGVASQSSAEAEAKPLAWAEALRGLVIEVERARTHGFTDQELQNARTAFLASAEHAAQTASTRDARSLISRMNHDLTDGELPRSAAQSLDLQRQLLPGVTIQEVRSTFASRFAPEAQMTVVLLPQRPDVPVPSRDDVLTVVRDALKQPSTPWKGAERLTALLDDVPEAGVIAEEAHDAVLDVTHITFANNVRLHYRFMDFKKDEVTVVITLAGGKIRETEAQRGITAVAALPLIEPATSRFSSTALRDYMTGKKVRLRAMMTDDAIQIRVDGTPDALAEGLELAHVLLRDATIEPASVALWQQQQLQALEARQNQVQDMTLEATERVLSGNDPRMRVLTAEQVKARAQEISEAQLWLEELLQTAPMEVAVVGDLPQGRALALAATYLGSLPKRPRTDPSLEALRQIPGFRGPVERQIEVETITPRALPVLMWRSAPWSDVKGRRLSYLVASILEGRIREEIRETYGLTYSTNTYAKPDKIYPAMSALYVQFTTDPGKTQEAVQLARNVVEAFATEGPTDDEVQTARKQISNAVETMLQEPHFWVNLLSDLDYHGTRLDDVHGLIDKLMAFSKADIAAATRQIVRPERFALVVGQPK